MAIFPELLPSLSTDDFSQQTQIPTNRTTREDKDPANPLKLTAVCNLAVCSTSRSSIKISWQSPEIKCSHLQVYSVRINCNQIDNVNDSERPIHIFKELAGDALYYIIDELPERTRFRINVSCSINHKCESSKICGGCRVARERPTAEVEAITWGTTPARGLTYKVKSANSVLIRWQSAKTFGHNKLSMQVLCYHLAEASTDPNSNEPSIVTRIDVGSSKKSYHLTGLKSGSEYIAWLEIESSCRLVRSESLYVALPDIENSAK